MSKDARIGLAMLIGGLESSLSEGCPICEQPYNPGQLVHRECLKKKHGGTLPEGFEELIEAFELDVQHQ